MSRNTAHRGVAVIGCALALTGCGAGFKYNDAIGRLPPPGTEVPLVAQNAGPPPDTGSGAVTPVPAQPGPTRPGPGTAVPSAFCQDMADLQGLISALLQPGGAAKAAQSRALVQRLNSDAPAALRADITVLLRIQDRIIADVSATPVNVADLAAALADPTYRQALSRVVVYAAQHCSINLTPPGP